MSTATQALPRRFSLSAKAGMRVRRWSLRSIAIVYLAAMIALPAAAVIREGFVGGFASLRDGLATAGAWQAIELTLVASALAAVINVVMGTMLAYALVRYEFPGRQLLSAIVDLPLAIPTLVAGVMILVLYGPNTPVGQALSGVGIHVVFAQLGVLLALLVVTLPFVVRTVQPVLLEIDAAEEEAAATLGASAWTTFRRIVLPALRPAIAAGGLLVFARSLGEFGSIVVMSGNIPGRTLTIPVLISQLASQFKPDQAAAIASVFFAISFVVVLATTRLIRTRKEDAE